MSKPQILVTGDFIIDQNVYGGDRTSSATAEPHGTVLVREEGGAWIVHRLLVQMFRASPQPAFTVLPLAGTGEPSGTVTAHSFWKTQEFRERNGTRTDVWRLSEFLGFSTADLSTEAAAGNTRVPLPKADVLVVDDNAVGLRFQSAVLTWKKPADMPRWIVFKTVAPLFQGRVWHELIRNRTLADRLVTVVSISNMRRENVRISAGISWERTATDLMRELKTNPALEGLRRARHVVVELYSEGCLWMERVADGNWEFRLVFDPAHMEQEWPESQQIKGDAYGYTSCLTAALAGQLASGSPDMENAIRAGLASMRKLRQLGHGQTGAARPGMPYETLAEVILNPASAGWRFASVTVPADVHIQAAKGACWRILAGNTTADKNAAEPLFGVAKRIALFGQAAFADIPFARFGKLMTADRDEIEALRNIRRLIRDYQKTSASRPLSLAVFGPPGAGKSFGINEIAAELLGAGGVVLEFNLSQFPDPGDLIGAFHQIRDKVLEGKTPIVFWDEFDSGEYKWLQYFLAPMQDGKFQEGQITHSVGKSVFVFAGATSCSAGNFGPSREDLEAYRRFVLFKGPDFVSRVHGTLNVLGPNRRQLFVSRKRGGRKPVWAWQDDAADRCFPIRRALLLRALLKAGDKRLVIDRGLLAALLETGAYTHGARSFEKIASHLAPDKTGMIRRSSLPPDEILKMNLKDPGEFERILTRQQDFQRLAETLAPAIHDTYRQLARDEGWTFKYNMPYGSLPPEIQAENVAAAHRIPWILELAGLSLARKRRGEKSDPSVTGVLSAMLDVLAEEEHDLWMDFKLRNGWRYGDIRNDDNRAHDCLKPYRELSDKDQKKDKNSVITYPRIAERAGYKIVFAGAGT